MFLANENFPKPSTSLRREKGYEVGSIQEEFSGIRDEQVIAIALRKKLIILTFDSDYGELIFRYATKNPPSVAYFRSKGNSPLFAGELLIELLSSKKIELRNCFTVIEETGIRQRFYPQS
jgi:predicted nuclease of predicted toxin-antitoxin system